MTIFGLCHCCSKRTICTLMTIPHVAANSFTRFGLQMPSSWRTLITVSACFTHNVFLNITVFPDNDLCRPQYVRKINISSPFNRSRWPRGGTEV